MNSREIPSAKSTVHESLDDLTNTDVSADLDTLHGNHEHNSSSSSETHLTVSRPMIDPASTQTKTESPHPHMLPNGNHSRIKPDLTRNKSNAGNDEKHCEPGFGSQEPIAIIGMSFQFPGGATTEESFWNMLTNQHCASSEYPADRLNIDAFYSSNNQKGNSIHTRQAHFLEDDIRNFDASFFSVTPAEAGAMDPNQKGLMETTYHAIENAGLSLSEISGSDTSVHVGFFASDHMLFNMRDSQMIPKYYATGSSSSILSNRISWFFNLRGPSMTIDTACSSGLVALNLACEGLWSGTSKMAIVGASNLILTPELNIALSNMNFLSHDGKCYSFDYRASGYARGEGVTSLVLKPLSQAIAAGDPIRSLIRSVGTNQDGHTSGGITQPNKDLQSRLIRDTYRKAGLDMRKTRYFEAHGTGTAIGDPLEAQAIGESFRSFRSEDEPMYVGAVKSNIGHLEAASGLAGVVKTILAMEKGMIPPNTNFERLNPNIDGEFFHLEFPKACIAWPNNEEVKRASVNSFGFGGTNAHVVLDDAASYTRHQRHLGTDCSASSISINEPFQHSNDNLACVDSKIGNGIDTFTPKLLILSASSEAGLSAQIRAHASYLRQGDTSDDADFISNYAYTLAARRTLFGWRSFGIVNSRKELIDISPLMSEPLQSLGRKLNLGLVFTGQGAQWLGMGQQLFSEPVFKTSLEQSQEYLNELGCEFSVVERLCMTTFEIGASIDDSKYSQIMTTSLQLALVDLMEWLDLKSSVAVGHSSGEIAAAYVAGYISHRSAIAVSYYRSVLGEKLERNCYTVHRMAAVGLSPEAAELRIKSLETDPTSEIQAGSLTISCVNSTSSVTISGPESQLDVFIAHIRKMHVFGRKLKVKLGYHSPQMLKISEEYHALLANLTPRHPALVIRPKMISSVTGRSVNVNEVCTGSYWVRNMVSRVDFLGAISFCSSIPGQNNKEKSLDREAFQHSGICVNAWLEIGPHSTLKGPILETAGLDSRGNKPLYTSALIRNNSALSSVLYSLGLLYCSAFHLNTSRLCSIGLSGSKRTSLTVLPSLPKYQFDHSVVHWEESNLSKSIRFRKHGPHDLLGLRITEPNDFESQWKFIIKEDDMPWVRDHKINGTTLYPAAGMLVMAIEALKQLANDRQPMAVEFENVEFPAPIIVPSTSQGVEVRLHMSSNPKSEKGAVDYRFRVFVSKAGSSHEVVCSGTIRADYGRMASDIDGGNEDSQKVIGAAVELSNAESVCKNFLDSSEMYKSIFDDTGIYYGPDFRALDSVSFDGKGLALATLLPYDFQSASDYTVHPSRLDGIFQLVFAARNSRHQNKTMVPTRANRILIPLSGFGKPGDHTERVYTKLGDFSDRHAIFNIKAVCASETPLVASVEGFEITAVSANVPAPISLADSKYICSHMEWKADMTALDSNELFRYCESARALTPEPVEWYDGMDTLVFEYGLMALQEIERERIVVAPSMEKYVSWLRAHIGVASTSLPKSYAELEQLHERVLPSTRGEMHIAVGKHLVDILQGSIDPFEMIFQDDAKIADFYRELMENTTGLGPLNQYLDLLVHKNPDLKFLEVGGGTASSTKIVLQTIGDTDIGPRFEEYTFTDITPFFLEKAKEKFDQHEKMTYRVLNIEEDVLGQGFDPGSYDVIIADNVLHATRDIRVTVNNIRKLLRPGGKLILKELVHPSRLLIGLLFGLLPGWWLSHEEDRQMSPLLSEDRWDGVLKECGFSGAELIFRDHLGEKCQLWSIMITTALEGIASTAVLTQECSEAPTFICDPTSQLQTKLAASTFSHLRFPGNPQLISLRDASTLSETRPYTLDFIFLNEVDDAILRNVQKEQFTWLQKSLKNARSFLWVKGGGVVSSPRAVDYSISEGMNRVFRLENGRVGLVSLALESPTDSSFSRIARVFQMTQGILRKKSFDFEPEYSEIEGTLCVNRLRKATQVNEHILRRTAQPVLRQKIDNQKLRLGIRAPGLLDTIQFSEDETFKTPLGRDELDIEVRAIGVNYKDCLALLGRLDSDLYGSECVGVVRATGEGVVDLNVGDRVLVGSQDTFKTYVRAHKNNIIQIPDSIGFRDAAAIFTAYCTAYHSIINIAKGRKGNTILIHAAAGGTGQAMVQIAYHIGAEVFATVGSLSKKEILMRIYGIPADHIFYSRDSSFADGVKRMTKGRGVDIVINSVGGRLLEASWDCIASFGHFVDIGLKDAFLRHSLPMHMFTKNATFSGVNLTTICENADGYNKELMKCVLDLFVEGKMKVQHPLQVYSIEDTELAFRSLQAGQSSGKMVIEVNAGGVVPIVQSQESNFSFLPNVTYLISGGLGGLGRNVARWLVRRGAKHLILISRSGPDNNAPAQEMLKEFLYAGVDVQCPVCDIVDLSCLKSVLAECMRTMPPIRGCIQAAMSLSDATFTDMSIEQWRQAIKPKVDGSWNLHLALPPRMDFFILFASCSGISGNSGQANYAAGNTYQDALARYRTSIGEKALSLDLGVVRGDGFFSNNQQLLDRLLRLDMLVTTSLPEIFAIMDHYCNPSLPPQDPIHSQVITGFRVPADILAIGKDIPTPMQKPLFRYMLQARGSSIATHASAKQQQTLNFAFANAASPSDKASVVSEALRIRLSKVMGVKVEHMGLDQPLTVFGVDSLVGLELRNWLTKETGVDLAVFEILGGLSLTEIGAMVAKRATTKAED